MGSEQQIVQRKQIKCVVWDLDNTLWDGILLEDEAVTLRPELLSVLQKLDERGILHSIASKNDHDTAVSKLKELGIYDYFLYPQISWQAKSTSIQHIARLLNIGIDTLAFIDDQAFERDEVAYALPDVLCLDAQQIATLVDRAEMLPDTITADARRRRLMYLSEIERQKAEKDFTGTNEEFLTTLKMVFTISRAHEQDLKRAEELTVRTHQLNTTGYTYSYEELRALLGSSRHRLIIAELEDKYGSYGKIGLVLLECEEKIWTIKLLLMSCRVISRGVGSILLSYIIQAARRARVQLRAEFISNDRNRMMLVTYKFHGFKPIKQDGNFTLFEYSSDVVPAFPDYVQVIAEEL
ncbi:HAD superfamily phosphatase (TIGR01681 family)/FkbH-like protein [Thermosporothrix hazakensis]|jgi:FkbH-like protein|uniref:HAD superfamily phosphatase (TIGR01681 family)/FkbH-like protein n=2 Tax=Thermosporothrix TaxID=768650 RepID=A0A326U4E4_THEHA|nr:HAD-IIIC family phosphatase [Thermosporothrix hazakensis]PZW26091.1 HAD superfamily phosphatase (TIGR01681 family)/FkbH-like protein [Thermosporothrix hazakensis]BBH87064.1 hypothetical protein KTC_18150 [Thermosporothrix sp. COM3]GCE51350.1 hypothetical protein KTH_62190 [Thermosporothrix hazakensis]